MTSRTVLKPFLLVLVFFFGKQSEPNHGYSVFCFLFLEGSAGASSDGSDAEYWIKPPENSLIPAMLSPPESLLVACILRGNYIEAHQVMAQKLN